MESKNDEKLQEFSEPLLRKTKLPFIKTPIKLKKDKNSNKNNNYVDNNPGLRSNESTYSFLPINEVTQGAVEVWANLPDEIRKDPSFKSFWQQHERIYGKLIIKSSFRVQNDAHFSVVIAFFSRRFFSTPFIIRTKMGLKK